MSAIIPRTSVGRVLSSRSDFVTEMLKAAENVSASVSKASEDIAQSISSISLQTATPREETDNLYRSLEPRLQQVLAFQPATENVRYGLRALKKVHITFQALCGAWDYLAARQYFPELESAVAKIESLKTEYEQAERERQLLRAELGKFATEYGLARTMQALTDNLATAINTFNDADDTFQAHFNRGRYAEAHAALLPLEKAVKELVALKKTEHDGPDSVARAAAAKYKAYQQLWSSTPMEQGVNTATETLLNEMVQARTAFVKAWNEKDYNAALSAATKLENQAMQLAPLKAQYETDLALKRRVENEYQKITGNLAVAQALAFQAVTPSIEAALQTLWRANADYQKAFDATEYQKLLDSQLGKLDVALKAVAKAKADEPSYDTQVADVRKECDTLRTDRAKLLGQLGDFFPETAASRDILAEMRSWSQRADKEYARGEWLESRNILGKHVLTRLAHLIQLKPKEEQVAEQSFNTAWSKVEANYKKVSAWKQDVVYNLNAGLNELATRKKAVDDEVARKNYPAAGQLLQPLESLINQLLAQESVYLAAEAAFQNWQGSFPSPKIKEAIEHYQKGCPHPLAKPEFDTFEALNNQILGLTDAGDYAGATTMLPNLEQAAVAFVNKVADASVATFTQAREAAQQEYKSRRIDDRRDAVGSMNILRDYDKLTPKMLQELARCVRDQGAAFEKAKVDGSWNDALKATQALDTAITQLESLKSDYDKEVAQRAGAAGKAIKTAQDPAQLKVKTPKEKVDMLKELLVAPDFTPEHKKAQREIFKSMKLDSAWEAQDRKQNDDLLDRLTKDADLKKAKDGWDKMNADERIKALRHALHIQSAVFGTEEPDIAPVYSYDPLIGMKGRMRSENGKMELNAEAGALDDFKDALNTVLHENTHNYQDVLIDRFNSGELKPGDPEYTQAMMFAINKVEGGYLLPSEVDLDEYKNQPREMHAHLRGDELSEAFCR